MTKKAEKEKFDVFDPEFKKKLNNLFDEMNKRISELYNAATKDMKTKTYTYNFFKTALSLEIEKAKRGKEKISLLIIDIDFFKKVNDTYGHVKGDEILIKMADVLKKSTRKYDIVSRFGGEEFAILFPEMELKEAEEISERIRKKIQNNPFLKKYKITISGGVTEFKKNDTVKKIIERADSALYQAKKTGRNKILLKK
ncbi:GGDEF domain-containing protein [Candidatus Pacearchaeota archaeon]|nr:GGDEF domain-containing protein [Candidatus Pacearchaeota archaeon]